MKLLNSMMAQFVKVGQLTIIDADGNKHVHGPGGHPEATIRITDKALYKSLFLNPELRAGEAYMDGTAKGAQRLSQENSPLASTE